LLQAPRIALVLFHGWTDIAVRKHGSNATMLPAAFSIATIVTFNTANSHFAWHKASHYAISKNAESSMQAQAPYKNKTSWHKPAALPQVACNALDPLFHKHTIRKMSQLWHSDMTKFETVLWIHICVLNTSACHKLCKQTVHMLSFATTAR